MGASYADVAFRLHLPTCLVYDDRVEFNFKFEYKLKNTEKIIYYKSILTDIYKISHSDEGIHSYRESEKIIYNDSISIWKDSKKIFVNNAILKIYFLSNVGERTEVTFRVHSSNRSQLLEVAKYPMSEHEKDVYVNSIFMKNDESKVLYSSENKDNNYESENISRNDLLSLDKYRKALKEEKIFLKHEGGRKYKVTNGKLISSEKEVFSYIFDLETELHISEDAPVKVSNGAISASGNVIMCEDFQIIIQLESNIGDKIGSAFVSVEPWKLLGAIEERLSSEIDISCSNIVLKLCNDGPLMSTNMPIDKIPKGQDAVITKAMLEPICIVWGPPGTGKTYTMSELAIRFINEGKTVLIVSHSNVSVDGVANKIDELARLKNQISILKAGKILRYGYIRDEKLNKNKYVNSFYYTITKNPELNAKLDDLYIEYDNIKNTKGLGSQRVIEIRREISKIQGQIREQEQRYVEHASVVATTISKVVVDKIFQEKKYDVVMFDEVSMAYVLQVVCAATLCREHLICVGDFMQLAPIAQSRAKGILSEDIFSFLGINQNGKPFYHPWLVMLNEQRRMHPKISAFANKYVYNRLLKDHISTTTSREKIVSSALFENEAINLINLSGCFCAASKNADNSRYNILSALIAFSIALKTESNVETISIITPYAAQTRLIRALVLDYRKNNKTEIRCATVHQFQGSESDVVLFDAVESYPAKKPGWLMGKEFNSILRLVNVAVTRARGKLVALANYKFWKNNFRNSSHTFYKLLKYIQENGNVIQHKDNFSLEALIEKITIKGGPEFYLKPEQYMSRFMQDIKKAKKKIVISLPCGKLNKDYESEILKSLQDARLKDIQVLIKSNEYSNLPEAWKEYTWGTTNAIFPITMIDDCISWYGVPLAPWKFIDGNTSYLTVCPIVCRIKGQHTAELIKSLSDLEYRESASGRSQLMQRSETNSFNQEGPVGLAAYVYKHKKCSRCKKPLVMSKGKSGKTILWCNDCKKTELLTPDDINHYILVKNIKCPKHKCYIEAKVGRYGLYIKCDAGHYIKPDKI